MTIQKPSSPLYIIKAGDDAISTYTKIINGERLLILIFYLLKNKYIHIL